MQPADPIAHPSIHHSSNHSSTPSTDNPHTTTLHSHTATRVHSNTIASIQHTHTHTTHTQTHRRRRSIAVCITRRRRHDHARILSFDQGSHTCRCTRRDEAGQGGRPERGRGLWMGRVGSSAPRSAPPAARRRSLHSTHPASLFSSLRHVCVAWQQRSCFRVSTARQWKGRTRAHSAQRCQACAALLSPALAAISGCLCFSLISVSGETHADADYDAARAKYTQLLDSLHKLKVRNASRHTKSSASHTQKQQLIT